MLYWLSSYCIMTITIIVYKMVVLLMAYCTCTVLLFFVFCLYPYCICGQFIFFYWAASQWAVRLLWQPSDCMAIFVILLCYYRKINLMMISLDLSLQTKNSSLSQILSSVVFLLPSGLLSRSWTWTGLAGYWHLFVLVSSFLVTCGRLKWKRSAF